MNERTNTPVARIDGVDEYGPRLGWFEHWARIPIGTLFYAHPSPEDTARLREDLERVTRELAFERQVMADLQRGYDELDVLQRRTERERDDTRKALETARDGWRNGCERTVPEALRFLADNERPSGGEEAFNAEHLHQLAEEIEFAARSASREGASDE